MDTNETVVSQARKRLPPPGSLPRAALDSPGSVLPGGKVPTPLISPYSWPRGGGAGSAMTAYLLQPCRRVGVGPLRCSDLWEIQVPRGFLGQVYAHLPQTLGSAWGLTQPCVGLRSPHSLYDLGHLFTSLNLSFLICKMGVGG